MRVVTGPRRSVGDLCPVINYSDFLASAPENQNIHELSGLTQTFGSHDIFSVGRERGSAVGDFLAPERNQK